MPRPRLPDSEWDRRRAEYARLSNLGDAVTKEEMYRRTRLRSVIKGHDTDALYSSAATSDPKLRRRKRWPRIVDADGTIHSGHDLWRLATRRRPGPRPSRESILTLEVKLDRQGPADDTLQDRIERIRMGERRRQARRRENNIDTALSSASTSVIRSDPIKGTNETAGSEIVSSVPQSSAELGRTFAPDTGAYPLVTIPQEALWPPTCESHDLAVEETVSTTVQDAVFTATLSELDYAFVQELTEWLPTVETYPDFDLSYHQDSSVRSDLYSYQQAQHAIPHEYRPTDADFTPTTGSESHLSGPHTDQWEFMTPSLFYNSDRTIQSAPQTEADQSLLNRNILGTEWFTSHWQ